MEPASWITLGGVLSVAKEAGTAITSWSGVKDYLHGCKQRLLAGRLTPGNHDLVRGIRTAQLCALDHVARRHRDLLESLPKHEIGSDESAFAASLEGFLRQRLTVFNQSAVDHDALKIEDIEHALDEMVHPAAAEGYADLGGKARAEAEARMLAEIEKDAGRPPPTWFRRAFQGEGAAGWYDACALFVTEELKTNERFRSIFFAAELIDTKRALAAIDKRLASIKFDFPDLKDFMADVRTRLRRIEDKVDAVLVGQARHDERFDELARLLAKEKGVPFAPLHAVLARLGETGTKDSDIPAALNRKADELLALRADLARLRNDTPEFAVLRARALSLIDMGEFLHARAVLADGRQRAKALREELNRTEAAFLADEARIDRLNLDYDAACKKLAEAGALNPDKVVVWGELGDLCVLRGNLAKAAQAFANAKSAAERNGNERDLSVSFNKIGDVKVAQGDLPGALKSFEAGLAIRERLAASDRQKAGWQRDLSVSFSKIGDVKVAQGDLPGALKSFEAGLAIAERLAASDPENAEFQRDLGVLFSKIGKLSQAQGDLPGAAKRFERGRDILERLAASDPQNAEVQRGLFVSFIQSGDVKVVQGDLHGALKSFGAALTIAERLAASDPQNAHWQRDLSVSFERIGDMRRAQGDLPGALKSFEARLAIAERLAASDPQNAEWQLGLSVSNVKSGDMSQAQGDLPGAAKYYEAGLVIAEHLAASDPGNAQWQRGLSVSFNKVGNVKVAQGDLPGALKSFEAGLAIAERLAASDPQNAVWQRDLALSFGLVAEFDQKLDRIAEACIGFRKARDITRRLRELSPTDAILPKLSAHLEAKIAELER